MLSINYKWIFILVTICGLLSIAINELSAQDAVTHPLPELNVFRTSEKIVLDGILDENIWKESKAAKDFYQVFPTDQIPAWGKTEIYFSYDNENLYVAAKCYSKDNDFNVQNLRRDYGFGSNDNLTLLFDTYNDNTNALVFGMNPLGARREAVVFGGGRAGKDFDDSWDNKWDGASKIYDDHWVCEMAIPFNSLRYDSDSKYWRFNSYRNDTQLQEFSAWAHIPRSKILMDMSCMGKLHWETPLPKVGKNISLIPYSSAAIARDFEDPDELGARTNFSIGGDAKISLSSSLNLDLTVNPDFSQVEVDQQVTNLDRFEIFFPERRQFFLENADLFSGFGFGGANPFFSRRIGIAFDTLSETNVENTIYYGARLSGKLNETTRVGLLNMLTAGDKQIDLPSFNHTVATLEKNIFGKSNVGLILVNKQGINTQDFGDSYNEYNRVAGIEYRLITPSNKWFGKTLYHRVLSPEEDPHKFLHYLEIVRNVRKLRVGWKHAFVGEGYKAELGFVPRRDIMVLNPDFSLRFFPNKEGAKVNQHTLSFFSEQFYKLGKDDNAIVEDFGFIENTYNLDWNISYADRRNISVSLNSKTVKLIDDFDPTRIQEDNIFLPAGSQYTFSLLNLNYGSDGTKDFFYRVNLFAGSFFNGDRYGVSGEMALRFPPYASVSLRGTYNHIALGGLFETADLYLIGPKIDFTFSKKLFFSSFIQYNSQGDNLNINSRLQWRFQPVSDFYLVYTDNYNTDPANQFSSRNRAIVAKLTYWLNL